MKPLPFVFPYALVFWCIFVWAYWPEYQIIRHARESASRDDSPDAGSYRVIVIGMWLAFVAAFPLASVHRLQVPNTLRHPSYTAGVLMNAGIGLGLGSWGSATLLVVASDAVYSYRMAVEERALLSAVGEPYRECMRTRKRLIPFLY